MKRHLAPAMAMIMTTAVLSGCFGSDSDGDSEAIESDARWTPNTVSQETCENVALGQARRNSAPFLELNTDVDFSQAFAVWKLAVEEGQELTANLQVPANKDYNMALFSNLGARLACADDGLLGEDEEMTYTVVTGISTVWIKVWTASSPDNSEFTLQVSTPQPSEDDPVVAERTLSVNVSGLPENHTIALRAFGPQDSRWAQEDKAFSLGTGSFTNTMRDGENFDIRLIVSESEPAGYTCFIPGSSPGLGIVDGNVTVMVTCEVSASNGGNDDSEVPEDPVFPF